MHYRDKIVSDRPRNTHHWRTPGTVLFLVGAAFASSCSDDETAVAMGAGGQAGVAGHDAAGEAGDAGETTGGEPAAGQGGSAQAGMPAGAGDAGEAAAGETAAGAGGSMVAAGAGGAAGAAGMGGENGEPLTEGQEIFRYDTFGDEQLWTDVLQMHDVVADSVSPMTALSVGLKVDAAALPEGILETADLRDPATTVALLELDAVVGLVGQVQDGELVSLGITCALCHSDVDDSVMEGVGERLDGHANNDLNPGAILALSPHWDEETREVFNSWGPGFYDPRFNQDGINHPVKIPPIYGLAGVSHETYTGDGPISYWNSYVAVTQMGGQGQFFDPRIDVAVISTPDRVTPQLPALYEYQVSLETPAPPEGSFDADAAARGQDLFNGVAGCSDCHAGEHLTDANLRLHLPEEVGQEPLTAERSATGQYRTTPLRGLWQHPPYFHDGSAETLEAVVEHYSEHFDLELTAEQQADIVEYLKSL